MYKINARFQELCAWAKQLEEDQHDTFFPIPTMEKAMKSQLRNKFFLHETKKMEASKLLNKAHIS
jgi:hypothetical protein